jgi:hypothetical protein
MKNLPAEQEWSHKVAAADIPAAGLKIEIEADERQRRDVARRLKVESVEGLAASFKVTRAAGSALISVTGSVAGRVTQLCVSTGKPVVSEVYEEFDAYYTDRDSTVSFIKARHERLGRMGDAEVQILEEHDDPEPLTEEGEIDLGELAVQYLSLAVEPYPRAEEAKNAPETTVKEPETHRPFEALKNWKQGE